MKKTPIIFLLLTFLLVNACTSTKKRKPDNFFYSFAEGPCLFGRVKSTVLNADPAVPAEVPASGYLPAAKCLTAPDSKEFETHPLGQEWLNYDWSELYFDGSTRFVALLDWSIEGGFEEIPLMESIDSGKSWHQIAKIKKPHSSARPTKITFDDKGHGEILLEWEPKDIVVWKLVSNDNGKSWSRSNR